MTEEQEEKALSFALDLLDLIENKKVVGNWEIFVCRGASDILIELIKQNMNKNKEQK